MYYHFCLYISSMARILTMETKTEKLRSWSIFWKEISKLESTYYIIVFYDRCSPSVLVYSDHWEKKKKITIACVDCKLQVDQIHFYNYPSFLFSFFFLFFKWHHSVLSTQYSSCVAWAWIQLGRQGACAFTGGMVWTYEPIQA